jgi:flagellar motor switch protein FliN
MAAPAMATLQSALIEAIRKAIADVFTQTLASSWSVEISNAELKADDATRVSFGLSFSGALQGSAAIQLRQADALALAQKLRSETADPAAQFSPEHKQALEAMLQQISAAAAANLQNQVGTLEAKVATMETPTWPGSGLLLQASEASAAKLILEVRFDPELMASLTAPNSPGTVPSASQPGPPAVTESNLDLLLGVGLSLTLRFGQRVLTLREILDLSSGSVVELDRQVQEPADLLLGDRLIARGEVVIVDGNYGVRVTEVVDPRQRIDRL